MKPVTVHSITSFPAFQPPSRRTCFLTPLKSTREGAFLFWLREAKAGNTNLDSSDFKAATGGLRIQSWYPPGLIFAARRR